MEGALAINIIRWSVWAPGIETRARIQEWAAEDGQLHFEGALPRADYVPAMLRRRCSNATRIALGVARAVLEESDLPTIHTVFSSRHGESEITLSLLESLARGEPLSPMGFSLSVHNSASGLFSIAAKNKHAATSLASRTTSFSSGLIEALGILKEQTRFNQAGRVLYICSDDQLPEVFREEPLDQLPACAVAMLLGVGGPGIELKVTAKASGEEALNPLSFSKFLVNSSRELIRSDEGGLHLQLRKLNSDYCSVLRGIADVGTP